jgi:hypothetical protein
MRKASVSCSGLVGTALAAGILILLGAADVWAADSTAQTQSWQEAYDTIRSITDTPSMQGSTQAKVSYQLVNNGAVRIEDAGSAAGKVIYVDSNGNVIDPSKDSNQGKIHVTSTSTSYTYTTKSSNSTGSSRSSDKDDSKTGPGAASADIKIEDNYKVDGPKVEEITLSETYYQDFGVYSESIGGYYFFYTNVGNNGITDQPVSVDLPANLVYTLQKDGVTIPYTSRQTVSEMGTYLFKITAVKNPEKPLAQQTIYTTTYNFRIQPKLPTATAAAQENRSDSYYTSDYYSYALNQRDDIMTSTYRPQDFEETQGYDYTEPETVAEPEPERQEDLTVEETQLSEEETTEAFLEETTEEATSEEETAEEAVLADGILECTITETSNGVLISYDPDEVETIVLSNGKSEETYTSLTEIRTPGKYTLYLYDKEGNVREYSFRVRRHINAASVLSILLVIAIIAVGVIFYRRTKNDMNLK